MDEVGAVLLARAQGGSHMGAVDCRIAAVVEAEHQPEPARRHAVFPLRAADGPRLDLMRVRDVSSSTRHQEHRGLERTY